MPLRRLRRTAEALNRDQATVAASVRACLEALGAAEAARSAGREPEQVAELAARHGVDPGVLAAWIDLLGPSPSAPPQGFLLSAEAKQVGGHASIAGWSGDRA